MTGTRVYLERFGAPARQRLQQLLADAKGNNPLAPVTVVTPTGYAGISLRHILAGDSGLLNVGFMGAARLAEYLGAPLMAARGKQPLSPLVELAAVRAVAGQTGGEGIFGPVAQHPSLHRSLRATFRDLARLSDGELDRLAAVAPLQEETVRLFRLFRDRTQDYYNQEDMARAACAAVSSGTAAAALRDIGAVIFFLTTELTPAEAALARLLGAAGECSLILGLTGDAEVDAVARAQAESFAPGVHGGEEDSPDDRSTGFYVDGIVSAPDVREEVRQAVRDILRAAGDGTPFHRMAALYRQSDPYAHQLRMELGLAGIPTAGPSPAVLRDSAVGRLLLGFLDVVEGDFGRARLMEWLAESPVTHGSNGAPASVDLMHWETLSRKAGVVRGLEQWRERLRRYVDRGRRDAELAERQGETSPGRARGMEEQADRAPGLLAFINDLEGRLPPSDGSPWSAFGEWGKRTVEYYAANPADWPQEEQSAYERVLTALEQFSKLDAVESGTTRSAFRQALEQALAASAGRSGATGAGVFVAGVGAAQGMDFDAVWIFGMAEGAFPPRSAEDPLLPDTVRSGLGEGKLPLRQAGALEERRMYLASLAAGKRRYLSYSRTDPGARRGQHPAPWLLDAAAVCLGNGLAEARVSSQELTGISAPWLSVIQSPQHSLVAAAGGRAADGHEFDLAALDQWRQSDGQVDRHPLAESGSALRRSLDMDRARGGAELTAWDGCVGEAAPGSVRLSGALTRVVSPTRLESWARCPYQFFLGSVLSLSAWETPEDVLTISPMDRGSLVHGILEDFIKESLQVSGPPAPGVPWGAAHAHRLTTLAEERFRQAELSGLTGRRIMWQAVKEDILRELEIFLEKDSARRAEYGVQPWYAELSFGFDGSPATLSLPDRTEVRFRGYIDRVDVAPDFSRAVVVDYKTGIANPFKDIERDALGRGTHLQLPVYALAVRDFLLPDAAVQAEYWFVSTRGGFERIPVSLEEVESDFKETVQTIVRGIREGVFPANPGEPGQFGPANCGYCDFQRICPTGRAALWERKQSSPQAAPYTRLAQPSAESGNDGEEA